MKFLGLILLAFYIGGFAWLMFRPPHEDIRRGDHL